MVKVEKILFFFILYGIIALSFAPSLLSNADEYQRALPILKIAIINSYDIDHVCGAPQMCGIIDGLNTLLGQKYKFDIQIWYMKSITDFNTPDKIDYISKKIISDIDRFAPDYVFTIDDAAFYKIGAHYLKTHKVFFSGLNKPVEEYHFTNVNNLVGVQENISLSKLFKALDRGEYYPNKIWIISDYTTVSHYLSVNYKEELERETQIKIETIQVSTLNELRKTLSLLQKENPGIIIHTYQALTDTDYNETVVKKYLSKEILKYNTKHLDICENEYHVKNGIGMSVAPDFYKMGFQLVYMFNKCLENNNELPFLNSDTILSINVKRLEETGFSELYRKIIEEVDYSYAIY